MRTSATRFTACILPLLIAACASGHTRTEGRRPADVVEAIDVTNRASFPIWISYYTVGGGPHPLGQVNRAGRQTFRLPSEARHIRVDSDDGMAIRGNTQLVGIVRYRVDPLTGERIGPPRVVR